MSINRIKVMGLSVITLTVGMMTVSLTGCNKTEQQAPTEQQSTQSTKPSMDESSSKASVNLDTKQHSQTENQAEDVTSANAIAMEALMMADEVEIEANDNEKINHNSQNQATIADAIDKEH